MFEHKHELKIIGKVQTEPKKFHTVDEFNLYYVKHKTEMEDMTTQKLNKSFNIDGYRITKHGTRDSEGKPIKGEICLKPAKHTPEITQKPTTEVAEISTKICLLETQIKELATTVNKIIEHLNA